MDKAELEKRTKYFAIRIIRAVSRPDFVNKIGIVEKEAAETQYWLELCEKVTIGGSSDQQWLLNEATELLAIFSSIGKTSKKCR